MESKRGMEGGKLALQIDWAVVQGGSLQASELP